MKLLNFILIFAFMLSLSGVSFAQKSDEEVKPEKQEKIKTAWSAGVSGGTTFLLSDVRYRVKGYGLNLNVNKALSHSMALRMRGGFGTIYGLNDLPSILNQVIKNNAINGSIDPLVDYTDPMVVDVYTNFKSTYKEAYIEALYYFPLTDFRRPEKQKARIYIFAGGGGFVFSTKTDQLDANGSEYSYANINLLPQDQRLDALKSMLDGTYETKAEIDANHNTEFLGGTLIASLDGGLGFNYSVTSKIDMFLEAAYTYTGNDLVDGVRWQIDGSLTGNDDGMVLVALGINYRFGKAENIYWFDNPEAMHYKITLQNKRKVDQLSGDSDGDGVSDYFDKDPETPSGLSVDGAGKPMDNDKDGIPDYIDTEPFSDKTAIVDSTGTALDSDADGVPDHRDLEPKTPASTLVNFQGKTIKMPEVEKTGTITPLGFIPVVFFDFNQAFIRPEYYNAALELADALKHYPNDKLRIIGHTDAIGSPEYNVELGKRRAQAVADILIASGIDKNRLVIESKGAVQPLSVISRRDMDKLNRRVQFEVVTGGVLKDVPAEKTDKVKPKEQKTDKPKEQVKDTPKEQPKEQPKEEQKVKEATPSDKEIKNELLAPKDQQPPKEKETPKEKKKDTPPPKTNDPEIDNLFKTE